MDTSHPAAPDGAPAPRAQPPGRIMRRFIVQPGFLLARIDQILTTMVAECIGDQTATRVELLLLLAGAGPMDQASLARAAGMDTSTTALVVDNLVNSALVVRDTDRADRRRARVALTGAGRRRLPDLRAGFERTQSRLVSALAADEAEALRATLRRIGANPASPAPPWSPPAHGGPDAVLISDSPGFLCRRALQVCQAGFLSCTGALNVTPRQFSVLVILHAHPDLSQAGFARLFGLDPSTCALIMKNLLRRGLLHRRVSEHDRRERLYSLTAEGERLMRTVQPLADRADRLVFRAVPAAERRAAVQRLQAVVRAHSHRLRYPGALFDD